MTSLPAAGAIWGSRLCGTAVVLGGLALLLMVVAGPGYRFGLLALRPALLIQTIAVATLLLVPLLAAAGLAMTGGTGGTAPLVLTWIALITGLLLSINNARWMMRAYRLPEIHDISTDLERPPAFAAVVPRRARAPNPVAYAGPEVAAKQRAAYPDIEPIRIARPPDDVYRAARAVVAEMGWELVAASAGTRRIEATDTTPWFGFKDDIVIRIRPDGDGARVDARSKSRVGRSDLGTNARRIRRFRARLKDALVP